MIASIRHRGPDGDGYWSDGDVSFGFTRLAIIDLETGNQPMTNEDGTVWVIFNGEIYNHRELRRDLEARGHKFHTDHSDTEVLVHGYEAYGPDLVTRLNGMFAFAIWDQNARRLLLARDRYGIKPLYWARDSNGALIFSSEIRAITASGLIPHAPDPDGVMEYFTQQNLWGEQTMFAGVNMFPPATTEIFSQEGSHRQVYWELRLPRDSNLSFQDAVAGHREVLTAAMKRQITADVPVSTYLSGGIDSSAISAIARGLDPQMRAYTCIFDLEGVGKDRDVDERDYARAVAQFLKIDHVELELPRDALVGALDQTIGALEDLRMGMSYENFLIARRVARDSKVVLSGTGGDELHCGYIGRYQMADRLPNALGVGSRLRAALHQLIGSTAAPLKTRRDAYRQMLELPVRGGQLEEAFTPDFLASLDGNGHLSRIEAHVNAIEYEDPVDYILLGDFRTYLHGLLVLEDKLSMANSLESRVPLLDNEVVDYVCGVPREFLFDGTTGKRIFRESVRPVVPDNIYRKPKMGFGPPDASWYRGPLREFIEDRLSSESIREAGVLREDFIRDAVHRHMSGEANNASLIWSLLSFDSWRRMFGFYGASPSKPA